MSSSPAGRSPRTSRSGVLFRRLWPAHRTAFVTRLFFAPTLSVGPDFLSWTETLGAEHYDVVYGDLLTMRDPFAGMGASVFACLAEDEPGTQIPDQSSPQSGEGVWFRVRPQFGDVSGSFDSGLGQAAARDAVLDAVQSSCAPGCDHNLCFTGDAIDPACSACAGTICQQMPGCCVNSWDATCVEAVRTLCGSLRCDDSRGSCAHTLCVEGVALEDGCDEGVLPSSCVSAICAQDPFCCGTAWDSICIGEVGTICDLGCD